MPQREGEEMQAMLEKFNEEMKKNMLESVEKALSAKAAAPPAAAPATGDGEASAQDLKAQLLQLQQTVEELKAWSGFPGASPAPAATSRPAAP